MKLSVIISTYNSEEWLHKVLIGFSVQTEKNFEVIIADDGSSEKTKKVVDFFRDKFENEIQHIWHEDKGFRKCEILNKAIVKSKTNYLLFTDGDCIPRNDFISAHLKCKEEGYFLSGGYFKLPMTISKNIQEQDIISQDCFKINWLKKQKIKMSFKLTKLIQISLINRFMNWVTTTKPSWNGHNSSGFKKDILAINGFNQSMEYGGEDRELGERLYNFGIFSKQIRYSAICIHLEHDRSYVDAEKMKRNMEIRKYNQTHKITIIKNGIENLS